MDITQFLKRRKKGIGWLAVVSGFALILAFPVASYYLFVLYPYYYLYHRPFREVTIDKRFSMSWEVVPPLSIEGLPVTARPVLLRFVENPNIGFVLDGNQVAPFQRESRGSIAVTFHLEGDRKKGVTLVNVVQVGNTVHHGPLAWRTICEDPCLYGPGPSPLNTAICDGPCGDHGRPGLW